MVRRAVAIVAADVAIREELVNYLVATGFDAFVCDHVDTPTAFGAVVLFCETASGPSFARQQVQAWLSSSRSLQVVVVTPQLGTFRALAAVYAPRLVVIPAPVFGWDLVDALRTAWPIELA